MAGVQPAERGLRPDGGGQSRAAGAGARPDQAATGVGATKQSEIFPPYQTTAKFITPYQMLLDRKSQKLQQRLEKMHQKLHQAQTRNHKQLKKIHHVIQE